MRVNLRDLYKRPEVRVMLALLGLLVVAIVAFFAYRLPGMPTIAETIDNAVIMAVFFLAFLLGMTTLAVVLILAILVVPVTLILGLLLIVAMLLAVFAIMVGFVVAVAVFAYSWIIVWKMFLNLADKAMILHYDSDN